MNIFRNRKKKKLNDMYSYVSFNNNDINDINNINEINEGWKKLHVAAYYGDKDMLLEELNSGVSVNIYSDKLASRGGYEGKFFGESFKWWWNKDKLIYWIKMTPLYLAAQRGHKDCVRILMERGADPHIRAFNTNENSSYSIADTAITWYNYKSYYIIKNTKPKPALLSN